MIYCAVFTPIYCPELKSIIDVGSVYDSTVEIATLRTTSLSAEPALICRFVLTVILFANCFISLVHTICYGGVTGPITVSSDEG